MDSLRAELMQARKAQDQIKMRTLQALIARIDNAEAVAEMGDDKAQGNQFFAGAKSGIGSTEVARKVLTVFDIQKIIEDEKTEILNALAEFKDCPDDAYAKELEKKIGILRELKIQM